MEEDSNDDVSQVIELYHNYSVAHKTLKKDEAYVCSRMVEVAKAFLMQKAKSLVSGAGNRPLLYSYGSDSTPVLTQKTLVSHLPGHKSIARRAGHGVDFLVEKGYIQEPQYAGFRRMGFGRGPKKCKLTQ
jgi:hypothetical protein